MFTFLKEKTTIICRSNPLNDEKIGKIHPLIAKLVALATSLRMFIISNISKDLWFQCIPAVSFDNDMTEMREGGTTKGKEVCCLEK